MDLEFTLGLIHNIALLVMASFLVDFYWKREAKHLRLIDEILTGIVLGIIAIIVMLTPWKLADGIVFDARSVLLAISGLALGFNPTLIAVIMSSAFRYYLGGDGAWMGIAVICTSGLSGWLYGRFRPEEFRKKPLRESLILGFLVHAIMVLCTFLLPSHRQKEVLEAIILPGITIYPLGTMLLGYFIINRKSVWITKKNLEKSEAKFKVFFENNTAPIAIINAETKIVMVNNAFCRIIGYSKHEIIGQTWTSYVSGADLHQMYELHQRRFSSDPNVPYSYEFDFYTKSGELRKASISITYLPEMNMSIASFLDVTDSYNYSETLKLSNELVRSIPSGLLIYQYDNNKLILTEANPASEQILGRQFRNLIGKNFTDIFKTPNSQPFFERFLNVVKTGEPYAENGILYQDDLGSGYYRIIAFKITDNKLGIAFDDVSKLKKAELDLIASEKRLWGYVEYAPDAIFIFNSKGEILDANVAARNMLGFTKNEFLEMNLNHFITELHSQLFGSLLTNVETESYVSLEKTVQTKQLKQLTGLLNFAKIEGDKYICYLKDITIIKANEIELIAAKEKAEESDRLKSAFLASMSHELRTPLNAIIGFSTLLENEKDEAEISTFAQIINSSGKQLLSIIESIFDIALLQTKQSKVDVTVFNGHDVLAELQNFVALDKIRYHKEHLNTIIGIENDFNNILLRTDKTKLIQILSNLLNNAIKYTDSGSVKLKYSLQGKDIIFAISDTGIGIPKEKQQIIFNRFTQVNEGNGLNQFGVGLGLAICKELSALLNGELRVSSQQGKGSVFYLRLNGVVEPN